MVLVVVIVVFVVVVVVVVVVVFANDVDYRCCFAICLTLHMLS